MYTRGWLKILMALGSLFWCVQIGAAPADVWLQAKLTWQEYSVTSPWQNRLHNRTVAAVLLDSDRVVFHFDRPVQWLRNVSLTGPGLTEISTTYLDHDDVLQLVSVHIDESGQTMLRKASFKPIALYNSLNKNKKIPNKLQIWDPDRHTLATALVSYKPSPATHRYTDLPLLHFSTTAPLNPGSLLLANDRCAGLLSMPDSDQGDALMLGSEWIAFYSRHSRQKPKQSLYIDWPPRYASSWHSYVAVPGFLSRAVVGSASRQYYELKSDEGGAMIHKTMSDIQAWSGLRQGDIVLSVNKKPVLADGSLDHPDYGRLSLEHWLMINANLDKGASQKTQMKVLRAGERQSIVHQARKLQGHSLVVPRALAQNAFLISGGLVLRELSYDYIKQLEQPATWMLQLYQDQELVQARGLRRIVVLDRILPLEINQGYAAQHLQLLTIDGIVVRDLAHSQQLIQEAQKEGRDIVFGFRGGKTIVLDHSELTQAATDTQKQHGIPFLSQNLAP